MTITKNQLNAVRAFNRVWMPKQERHEYGMEADAGFDGGEWSGPIHCDMMERDYYATMKRVAERFGLTQD